MKLYLSMFLLMFSTLSFAGSSTRTMEWESNKSTDEIISIMAAVDSLCQNGCTHYMPSVTRAQVVEQNAHSLVYWTFAKSIVDVSFFSLMTIKVLGDKTIIESNMLTFEEAKPYQGQSELYHSPGPMYSNGLKLEIFDVGEKRKLKATLSASGGAIVTARRLSRELNKSLQAYLNIL